MMLVLVLSSLLRPPDIAGAGRRLLSSNDRQSDITRYLVPCPGPTQSQGMYVKGLGMIVKIGILKPAKISWPNLNHRMSKFSGYCICNCVRIKSFPLYHEKNLEYRGKYFTSERISTHFFPVWVAKHSLHLLSKMFKKSAKILTS